MTKWLRMFAVLGAFVLIGAACQQQAEDGADGDQAGGAQATCDADEFGCVEIAEGDPITIGTLLVITGENASLGQDSQNGSVRRSTTSARTSGRARKAARSSAIRSSSTTRTTAAPLRAGRPAPPHLRPRSRSWP